MSLFNLPFHLGWMGKISTFIMANQRQKPANQGVSLTSSPSHIQVGLSLTYTIPVDGGKFINLYFQNK